MAISRSARLYQARKQQVPAPERRSRFLCGRRHFDERPVDSAGPSAQEVVSPKNALPITFTWPRA